MYFIIHFARKETQAREKKLFGSGPKTEQGEILKLKLVLLPALPPQSTNRNLTASMLVEKNQPVKHIARGVVKEIKEHSDHRILISHYKELDGSMCLT